MESGKRKRVLSEEEAALWAHVTRNDKPLEPPRPEPAAQTTPSVPAAAPPTQPAKAMPAPTSVPAQPPAAPVKSSQAGPPPPAPFDHREARRIARGRREIDARLDLHGFRQQDAHSELRRFLAHAQAKGHRHVLIITGKGKPDPSAERDFWTSGELGVLRRLVPHWLSEPALRPYVVSYLESAVHHGGSGALYVTIRKGPRARQKER